MEANIQHDTEDLRFYADFNGEEAELTYTYPEDDVLDLNHTFVPPSQRGKGIANKLIKTALEFAESSGFKIIPSCPVVASYVQRNPDYKDLVKEV